MKKECRVCSEISREEYRRLFRTHLLNNEKITLIYAGLILVISCGIAGVEYIVSVSFITAFFTIIYLWNKYKKFMRGYTKEQIVIFSEAGMRDEENISYIHWISLKNISKDKSWLFIKGGGGRIFLIKREALSTEQGEVLNKRLRGI